MQDASRIDVASHFDLQIAETARMFNSPEGKHQGIDLGKWQLHPGICDPAVSCIYFVLGPQTQDFEVLRWYPPVLQIDMGPSLFQETLTS